MVRHDLPDLVGRIPREGRVSARRERATAEHARLPGITYMREASRAPLHQVVPSYANPLDAADESGAPLMSVSRMDRVTIPSADVQDGFRVSKGSASVDERPVDQPAGTGRRDAGPQQVASPVA